MNAFGQGGGPSGPPPAEEKKNLPALIIVKILLSQFNPI